MLKHIPTILSPELVKYLMEMGHGDEVVIADANFPAHRIGQRVVR
ncbi:fucose isomerase, partial [Streptococcus sanguinis]